ncbi:winged helix-turn-helix domain-containing protein [Pantoea sp. PNA 03-3]|uniref:winged helix-turn-helix domain-containing protein n=1 Tax=Pantoea sp. PNA 03-3 TaxID=2135460 RepID=UPI000D7715A3|nr:winged helix-turn-helix domain-containing protein [Pantoea sp. PNA 03-3]PXV76523.1 DNA-binding winged helix-turn-helix (wHTH) protein [Pantoea sp. PNA 03-3]
MKKISIGNEVVFYPGKREIVGNNQVLKLHSSVSYCFELLIARQGEIVDHEAFYQYAWRQFGMEVSANALYQSISLIRKALLACNIRQDVIRTIPRRGFMLANAVLIEESTIAPADEDAGAGKNDQKDEQNIPPFATSGEEASACDTTESVIQDDEDISENLIKNATYSEPESQQPISRPEPAEFTVSKGAYRYAISTRHLFITGLAVMTILVCGFAIMTFSLHRHEMIFIKRFDMNGCEIYANEKAGNGLVARIAVDSKVSCTERRKIYITAFTNGERISVLQCKNALSFFGSPDCISYYYIRSK